MCIYVTVMMLIVSELFKNKTKNIPCQGAAAATITRADSHLTSLMGTIMYHLTLELGET